MFKPIETNCAAIPFCAPPQASTWLRKLSVSAWSVFRCASSCNKSSSPQDQPTWQITNYKLQKCNSSQNNLWYHDIYDNLLWILIWEYNLEIIYNMYNKYIYIYIIYLFICLFIVYLFTSLRDGNRPHRIVTANDVGHWDQKHPKVLIVGKKNAKNLIAMYSGPTQFKKIKKNMKKRRSCCYLQCFLRGEKQKPLQIPWFLRVRWPKTL